MIPSARRNCRRLDEDVRHLGEQLADEREVRVRPRDELAGLQLVVAGEVESLKMGEDGVAQVVVDVPGDAPAGEPADLPEHEADHEQHAHQAQQRAEVIRMAQDRPVDDRRLDQRDHGLAEDGRDGTEDRDEDQPSVDREDGPQAAQPAAGLRTRGYGQLPLVRRQLPQRPARQDVLLLRLEVAAGPDSRVSHEAGVSTRLKILR